MNLLLDKFTSEFGLIKFLKKKLPIDSILLILSFLLNNKIEPLNEYRRLKKMIPLKKILEGTFHFNIINSRIKLKLKKINLELFEIYYLLEFNKDKKFNLPTLVHYDYDENDIISLERKSQYLNNRIEYYRLEKNRLFLLMRIIKLQIKKDNIKKDNIKTQQKYNIKKLPDSYHKKKHAHSLLSQQTRKIHDLHDKIKNGRKNIKKITKEEVNKYINYVYKKYYILSNKCDNSIDKPEYIKLVQNWHEIHDKEQKLVEHNELFIEKIEKLNLKKQKTEHQKLERLKKKNEKKTEKEKEKNLTSFVSWIHK